MATKYGHCCRQKKYSIDTKIYISSTNYLILLKKKKKTK